MTIFTVHLPKADYAELSSGRPDPARAVFVQEGFSRGAFVFGPLWLLSCGLWLAFLVWLVVIIALAVVAADFLTTAAAYLIFIAIELFLGLEGNNLRRGKLARRGYRLVEVVAGASREEAERQFFTHWAAQVQGPPGFSPSRGQTPSHAPPPDPHSDILGHFPLPEGRG
jgi:hypothetical protein